MSSVSNYSRNKYTALAANYSAALGQEIKKLDLWEKKANASKELANSLGQGILDRMQGIAGQENQELMRMNLEAGFAQQLHDDIITAKLAAENPDYHAWLVMKQLAIINQLQDEMLNSNLGQILRDDQPALNPDAAIVNGQMYLGICAQNIIKNSRDNGRLGKGSTILGGAVVGGITVGLIGLEVMSAGTITFLILGIAGLSTLVASKGLVFDYNETDAEKAMQVAHKALGQGIAADLGYLPLYFFVCNGEAPQPLIDGSDIDGSDIYGSNITLARYLVKHGDDIAPHQADIWSVGDLGLVLLDSHDEKHRKELLEEKKADHDKYLEIGLFQRDAPLPLSFFSLSRDRVADFGRTLFSGTNESQIDVAYDQRCATENLAKHIARNTTREQLRADILNNYHAAFYKNITGSSVEQFVEKLASKYYGNPQDVDTSTCSVLEMVQASPHYIASAPQLDEVQDDNSSSDSLYR